MNNNDFIPAGDSLPGFFDMINLEHGTIHELPTFNRKNLQSG